MKFSTLSTTDVSKASRTTERPLRSGQILRGEVLKLYPNNKADINLGGRRFVANLEVGLELGGKYHFQVTSTGKVLELKVLGEQLKKSEQSDLFKLLNQLGIKENKHHFHLLQQLVKNSIPFQQSELKQATIILKGEKNKSLATTILVEMIAKRLPISSLTFQALKISRESTLSEKLQSVLQHTLPTSIQGDPTHRLSEQLLSTITNLTERPLSFRDGLIGMITTQNNADNQTLFQIFKSFGMIPLDTSFTNWKRAWNPVNLAKSMQTELPFQLKEQDLIQVLGRIENKRNEWAQSIQQLTTRWNSVLRMHERSGETLSRTSLQSLAQDIKSLLSPYLNQRQISIISSQAVTEENIIEIYRGIQALAASENLFDLISLRKNALVHENFISLSPKQQFLDQIFKASTMLGLDYENQIVTSKSKDQVLQTIKGLLLQIGASQESGSEVHARLLHHIQGLQLQSVQETQATFHANLQIPAERLGLIQDLELEFEGKKNEDGQIDADYCRILFHLELNNIGETVIDVNIQNRAIALTVFNNKKGLADLSKNMTKALQTNLEKLDYRLSSISFKQLEEKKQVPDSLSDKPMEKRQGVDFRI
jgi:hypothetical protein